MKYYRLKPEVAGGFGPGTILDTSVHPPRVKKLNYEFAGWLGDALLTTFPCFIATKEAVNKLDQISATGVKFDDVIVTKSGEFDDLYPDTELPEFKWLNLTGTAGVQDFGLTGGSRIVVSERVLDVFKALGLANAIIEPFQS